MRKLLLLLLIELLAGSHSIWAKTQPIIKVSEVQTRFGVMSKAAEFIDLESNLTIDQVLKVQFSKCTRDYVQLGHTKAAYWLRFTIFNDKPSESFLDLEFNYRELDTVDVYEVSKGRVIWHMITGDRILSNNIQENSFFPMVHLELKSGDTKTYYCKIRSSSALQFKPTLWQQLSYFKFVNIYNRGIGIFIGFQVIRFLFIFIISRYLNQTYIKRYSLVAFAMLFAVLLNSSNLKTIWVLPEINNILLLAMHFVIPATIVYWLLELLKGQFHYPRLVLTLKLYLAANLLLSVLSIFYHSVHSIWWVGSWNIVGGGSMLIFSMLFLIKKSGLKNSLLFIPVIFIIFCQLPYSMISLQMLEYNEANLILASIIYMTEVISMSIFIGIFTKRTIMNEIQSRNELLGIRDKISADLHDELGSVLTQIAIQSELIKHNRANTLENERSLSMISNASRSAIHSMSDFIWGIKPDNDIWSSLIDRMRDHTDAQFNQHTCTVNYDISGVNMHESIQGTMRQHLFLIFKEAITNILKHSQPQKVEIKVSSQPGIFMGISNDINDPNFSAVKGGNGLKNMEKRAAQIGLKLEVTTGNNLYVVTVS